MRFTGFIAALGIGLLSAGQAAADKLSLNEVSNYLNGIRTAASDFTQINGDGTISTGELALSQ